MEIDRNVRVRDGNRKRTSINEPEKDISVVRREGAGPVRPLLSNQNINKTNKSSLPHFLSRQPVTVTSDLVNTWVPRVHQGTPSPHLTIAQLLLYKNDKALVKYIKQVYVNVIVKGCNRYVSDLGERER